MESCTGESGEGWTPSLSEAALVGRAQDGDLDAFETLVQQYQLRLFRFVYRMVRDHGDAEDIVQDVFVLVWRQLPTLTQAQAFSAWLHQIAYRRALAVIRTRQRRPSVGVDTDLAGGDSAVEQQVPDPGAGPAEKTETAEQLRSLDDLIAALPMDLRVCWILKEVNDLSYPEIADVLRVPVATVRGRIARARKRLAEGMSSWQ